MVVDMTPSTVRVKLGDAVAMAGALWADIKRDESTWLVQVGRGAVACCLLKSSTAEDLRLEA